MHESIDTPWSSKRSILSGQGVLPAKSPKKPGVAGHVEGSEVGGDEQADRLLRLLVELDVIPQENDLHF